MVTKASATVACLALAVLTTYAQAPAGGQRQAPSTTATPGTDAKKVIETMQDNLGMLRGMNRQDGVNRVELWGTQGTKVIGGKHYWQLSYVENTPDAAHRWESFLVGQDNPEIMIDDDETGLPMPLEQWRKERNPLARTSANWQ